MGLNPTSPGKAVVREQRSFPIKGKKKINVPLPAEEVFSQHPNLACGAQSLANFQPLSLSVQPYLHLPGPSSSKKWRSPRDIPHDAVRCREHLFPTRHAPLQQSGLRIPFQRLREEQNDWETLCKQPVSCKTRLGLPTSLSSQLRNAFLMTRSGCVRQMKEVPASLQQCSFPWENSQDHAGH